MREVVDHVENFPAERSGYEGSWVALRNITEDFRFPHPYGFELKTRGRDAFNKYVCTRVSFTSNVLLVPA